MGSIAFLVFVTGLSTITPDLRSHSPQPTQSACESRPELRNQSRDAATVQRLENAWSRAFLKGDGDFMNCLLLPKFTEILRSGDVKDLAYEIDIALRNRGKNLPIPDFPAESILLSGDVAVAYGETIPMDSAHKSSTRFADFYVWRDGRWRVFFAQQTAIAERPASANAK